MSDIKLRLTGPVEVRQEIPELCEALGESILHAAKQAVEERGIFHLAVSGGSTPEKLYMHLATEPVYRELPWDLTHLWVVDERRVPADDERSNWKMIRESLADHVPLTERAKHPVPVEADRPDKLYERELHQAMPGNGDIPRMDFVLLGMGEDCHTASLFPHSPALRVNDCCVALNAGEHVVPPPRVTMTYCMLNAARNLAVLVTGANKHESLQRLSDAMDEGSEDVVQTPILGISPIDGEITWYLDAAAAAGADQ